MSRKSRAACLAAGLIWLAASAGVMAQVERADLRIDGMT